LPLRAEENREKSLFAKDWGGVLQGEKNILLNPCRVSSDPQERRNGVLSGKKNYPSQSSHR
jgi:hypothetical protein